MRVLMTSIGRRVSLVKIFKEVYPDAWIVGGDYLKTAPALENVDRVYELPYAIDDAYAKRVLDICKKEKIEMVIPLIDTELELYARYKTLFMEEGILLMVSDEKAMHIALDKLETYHYYKDNTLFTAPYTCLLSEYEAEKFQSQKIVLKPKNGSSGVGIHMVDKEKVLALSELLSLDKSVYIAQEYVDFDTEVTTDIFVSNHKVIELCQRKRLKVRGGEVEQAITIKDDMITSIVEEMVSTLDFMGVINIQIMVKDNSYYLGEINARFGGGFPLSYYSGANMIEHLHTLVKKQTMPEYGAARYKENFCMLRYDDAVYIDEKTLNDRFSTL